MPYNIENTRNRSPLDEWQNRNRYLQGNISAAVITALPSMVLPLVWRRSTLTKWNGDYHTLPAAYTVRAAGGKGWKLSGLGEFVYFKSPEAAFSKANAHHVTQIMAAFGVVA